MVNFPDKESLVDYFCQQIGDKSIAVVGSSPKLKDNKFGDLIDSHDYIIRFNDADIRGYEVFTGSRTDLRLIGFTASQRHEPFFREIAGENSIFLTKPKNVDFLRNVGRLNVLTYSHNIQDDAFKYIDSILGGNFSDKYNVPPRNGLSLLVFLCLVSKVKGHISVFGMEKFPKIEGDEHFYNDGRKVEKIMSTWDKFHCPLDHELSALRYLLKSLPEKFTFY